MARTVSDSEPLLVRAPDDPTTGWGKHGRRIVEGLKALGVPMRFDPTFGNGRGAWADAIPSQWELSITPPTSFYAHPTRPTVLITTWESGRLPPDCVPRLNAARCILVPCEWNLVTFDACGVNAPMRVVPHGRDGVFTPGRPNAGPFTFGSAAALTAGGVRKNLDTTIRCFQRAFRGRDDVRLKIKLTPACPTPQHGRDPRIEVIQDSLTPEDLADWYRSLDVLVTTSHSEGFGLHNLEAMGCGTPVMGPRFSGMCEYLDVDNGYPVEYDLAPADKGDYRGVWCVPREQSVISAMRRAASNRDACRRLGQAAARRAEGMTWEASASAVAKALVDIGAWDRSRRRDLPAAVSDGPAPTVVFVTLNGWAGTAKMLASVREAGDPCKLVCIDNGSTDGTPGKLQMAGVRVIRNPNNEGFAAAVNRGIREAGSDDIVLLNNDAAVRPGWIRGLREGLESRPDAGLAGCRVSPHHGAVAHCGVRLSAATLEGSDLAFSHDLGQHTGTREVRAVTFCCVYIPRATIDRVGLLDERYFAYYEDVDYCLRVAKAGLKCVYVGGVQVTHEGQGCSRANSMATRRITSDSHRKFAAAWWPEVSSWPRVSWKVACPGGAPRQLFWMLDAANESGVRQSVTCLHRERRLEADPITNSLLADGVDGGHAHFVVGPPSAFSLAAGTYNVGMVPEGIAASGPGLEAVDEVWGWREEDLLPAAMAGKSTVLLGPCVDRGVLHPRCPGDRLSSKFCFLAVLSGWWELPALERAAAAFSASKSGGELYCLLPDGTGGGMPPGVKGLAFSTPPGNLGALYRSADCFVPLLSVGVAAEAAACGVPALSDTSHPRAWAEAAAGKATLPAGRSSPWSSVAAEVRRVAGLGRPR